MTEPQQAKRTSEADRKRYEAPTVEDFGQIHEVTRTPQKPGNIHDAPNGKNPQAGGESGEIGD